MLAYVIMLMINGVTFNPAVNVGWANRIVVAV
jgi:hypothetical protein